MSLARIFHKILINTHCKKFTQIIFKSKHLKFETNDKTRVSIKALLNDIFKMKKTCTSFVIDCSVMIGTYAMI